MTVDIFSPGWAEAVRDAVNAEPDADYKASKLILYWNWIDVARAGFDGVWALGCRELDRFVALRLEAGRCIEARLTSGLPDDATFALEGGLEDWRAIASGFDTNKAVMYRRLRLVRGDVFAFFDRIYFFTEALASIARVPVTIPEAAGTSAAP